MVFYYLPRYQGDLNEKNKTMKKIFDERLIRAPASALDGLNARSTVPLVDLDSRHPNKPLRRLPSSPVTLFTGLSKAQASTDEAVQPSVGQGGGDNPVREPAGDDSVLGFRPSCLKHLADEFADFFG